MAGVSLLSESTDLFLPPELRNLRYNEIPIIIELGDRAVVIKETHIEMISFWQEWRGILEYLCCVEFAYKELKALPKGAEIGGTDAVPARYHSAAMVFYSQAMLDNIAYWIKNKFSLRVPRMNCSFHKDEFQHALSQLDPNFESVFSEFKNFIIHLNDYRMEWVHRLSGGAFIGADKPPSETDANVRIVVPIDPKANIFNPNVNYLELIEISKKNNRGEWLYSLDEFADLIRNNTKTLTISILGLLLKITDN
jgi:hypothetical protein